MNPDSTSYRRWLKDQAKKQAHLDNVRKDNKPVNYDNLVVRMPWGCWLYVALFWGTVIYLLVGAFKSC